MNTNLRQTEVLLAADTGIKSNRTWIEIAIFRKESFLEAVETKTQLVDFS